MKPDIGTVLISLLLLVGGLADIGRALAQAPSTCGKPTSAECWRPAPGGPLDGTATDGGNIGADVDRLARVERCALGGNLASADCVALRNGGAVQTPTRLESTVSPPVSYRQPIIKWDMAVATLDELKTYGWYLHVDGVRQDLTGVRCGAASGSTPVGQFSCEIEVPNLAPGVHSLAVQSWIPSAAPKTASLPRVVIQ